jgi:hypothetical protein
MSYIPKYIIKRMFPKEECLQVVKKDGIEFIQVQMINVISPMTVPEGKIDLGGVKLPEDIGKYVKITVDGINCPVNGDNLTNDVMLFEQGNMHTWKSIFEQSSASGKTIPVGGKLTLLIRKSIFPADVQAKMKADAEVEVSVEVSIDNPVNISVKATLKKVGIDFDPKNT